MDPWRGATRFARSGMNLRPVTGGVLSSARLECEVNWTSEHNPYNDDVMVNPPLDMSGDDTSTRHTFWGWVLFPKPVSQWVLFLQWHYLNLSAAYRTPRLQSSAYQITTQTWDTAALTYDDRPFTPTFPTNNVTLNATGYDDTTTEPINDDEGEVVTGQVVYQAAISSTAYRGVIFKYQAWSIGHGDPNDTGAVGEKAGRPK